MNETLQAARDRRQMRRWLYLCSGLIALMVVVGGYVRLSRAGLSIVEWDVVTGVLPPVGEAAWQEAHDRYLVSPEGLKVNADMSVAEYQRIFYIEWFHRLLARLVGLVVALPLLAFLLRGKVPRGRRLAFVSIGLLFAFQGFLGWFMVASGLVDRPSVSHYRLTLHLLAALTLLALCLWQALGLRDEGQAAAGPAPASARRLGLALLLLVLLQITWGGFVAGLKAGHVSNTWPLMFGSWVPAGSMGSVVPLWRDLIDNAVTVHFTHRWLAVLVLALAGWTWWRLRSTQGVPREARRAAALLLALVLAQVLLGITTVLLGVQLWVALAHQATAVLLFGTTVGLNQRLRRA